MIDEILKRVGLTPSQAKTYMALIENGEQNVTNLASLTGESRTNMYQILDKLENLNLVIKNESRGKSIFQAAHPSSVEVLAERRRKAVEKNEKVIKDNIDSLINLYYEKTESPTVRTIVGDYGLKYAYDDILKLNKDVHFLRSTLDQGSSHINDYLIKMERKNYKTFGLTQKHKSGINASRAGLDAKRRVERTWFPKNDYKGAATVQVYGDRVSFVVFDEHQPVSTIVYSEPIAEAVKFLLETSTKYYQQNFDQD